VVRDCREDYELLQYMKYPWSVFAKKPSDVNSGDANAAGGHSNSEYFGSQLRLPMTLEDVQKNLREIGCRVACKKDGLNGEGTSITAVNIT
jgi:hypothetical protein